MMEENKNDRKNEYVIEGEKFNRIWGENSRKKRGFWKKLKVEKKWVIKEEKTRIEGRVT